MLLLLCLFGMICQLVLGQEEALHLECGRNMVYNEEAVRCVSKKHAKKVSCPLGYKLNAFAQCQHTTYNAGK